MNCKYCSKQSDTQVCQVCTKEAKVLEIKSALWDLQNKLSGLSEFGLECSHEMFMVKQHLSAALREVDCLENSLNKERTC